MGRPLKVSGRMWKKYKADILRHFAESIDDLIDLETDTDKTLLAAKLYQIQSKFAYLTEIAESSTNGRGEDK